MPTAIMQKQITVPMPAIVATILSMLLGGAQAVLVGHIVAIPEQWREMGIVLIAFFAAEGIDPVVGGNAYAMLKLPPWLAHLLAALLAALMTLSTSVSLPHLAATIVVGVVTVAAGMGFQPLTGAEASVAPEPDPPLVPMTVVTHTSEPPPIHVAGGAPLGEVVPPQPAPPQVAEGQAEGVIK